MKTYNKEHKINCQCCACKSIRGEYKKETHPCWKNTKHECQDCGRKITFYAKRCHKCASSKENNGNYKDGKSLKIYYCMNCKKEITISHLRCQSCESKRRIELGIIGLSGKKASAYIDGKSREPYSLEWTEELKEQIRKRDNYICQNCGMTEEEHLIVYGKVLDVHHIDYKKKNCKENNLITLCKQCNLRANRNRNYWQEFYQNKINNLLKEIERIA
jgi:hypothetical protein